MACASSSWTLLLHGAGAAAVRGLGAPVDTAAGGQRDRLLQRVADEDVAIAAVHHDDERELRDRRFLCGSDVDRLDVEERLLDGDHEEVAEKHGRPGLAEQRPTLGEHRILVDPGEDL